ncbi:helix-turn-helix domain-containing protein [Micromonospora sp. NPDC050200]|uniref:helix-turn-helix domain-containing protein n=1 Tax=Micromonospora sp. NPDC050200 TaxID=3155664 RepID=UPI0033D21C5A
MSDRRRTRTPSLSTAPAEPATTRRWTEADVRALGVTTDVVTAGQILGLSRNTAYRLARTGAFPVPVIQAGHQYRIPVAGLLAALQLGPTTPVADGGDPHPPAP